MDEFMDAMTNTELQDEPIEEPAAEETVDMTQTEIEPEGDTAPENQPAADEPQAQPQSAEENAKYAAARRKAELEMRTMRDEMEQMRQENMRLKQSTERLAKMQNFDTFDALMDAVNQQERDRQYQALTDAGLDPKLVQKLINDGINNHPDMIAARQMKEAQKQQETRAQIEAAVKDYRVQVEEIAKLDDRIKGPDDLPKMDNYELFDELVRKHRYRPIDAYRLANFDRLAGKQAAAAQQATRNSINSRSHLKPSTGNAGEPKVVVPQDVMAMYRALNPDASDAEIRKHYAQEQQTKGE